MDAVQAYLKEFEKGQAIPEFYMDVVENTFRSSKEGKPCFDELETVRIWVPGDRNSTAVQRVSDEHKARWPAQYAAFKEGQEAPLEGTPLAEWPPIKRSQVLEFAHFHVRTVEQLAGIDDNKVANLGMGARELREQARKFLEVAKSGTGPIAAMLATIDSQGRELEAARLLLKEATDRISALEEKADAGARSK